MKSIQHQLSTYERAQTSGLNQRDLIIKCYQGAINFLTEAKNECEAGNTEAFGDLVEKTHRVVLHLYTTLDMEKGGEIARRLADLYAYTISQLYVLNATKNLDLVDAIVDLLNTVKEGWEGIDMTALNVSAAQATEIDATKINSNAVSVEV